VKIRLIRGEFFLLSLRILHKKNHAFSVVLKVGAKQLF